MSLQQVVIKVHGVACAITIAGRTQLLYIWTMTDTTTISEDDESRLDTPTCPPTNLYSQIELGQIQHALRAYLDIKVDLQQHRTKWLKVIGPVLVMVRDKAIEVAGTARVTSQVYRVAIGEE